MTTDREIYRMEEIIIELTDLLDEANAIVSGSDDYMIDARAKSHWLRNMMENLRCDTNKITMQVTIAELWSDYHARPNEDTESNIYRFEESE